MDFNTTKKLLESGKKRPLKTFAILVVSVILVVSIAYVRTFFEEKAKQAVNKSSQPIKVNSQGGNTFQTTSGDQSPAIMAGGNVTIVYRSLSRSERETFSKELNNSHKLIDRLLRELNAKEAELSDKRAKIEEWVKKYEELKTRIAELSPTDKRAVRAKEALIEGDLKKAGSTIKGVSFRGGNIQ